ncbi:MAG: arginine--tRNA ligase [Aminobacterium sp.]|jgi:arginyl-tRNA synthetase|uniref:arginine--tRNA ligase n=1 Tax=unclassified Aminobacterium TaxID=2685012 RepID=UPI001BCFC0C3|nr:MULTISPECIES: arginine--tRNA ligase [unclassified Aminobacterium]MDD2206175.1 arginine--tRNA ligase [Aminobacterium sp.]MDD3425470.1 arginine--tRNA ligase [Aminobacterium sp.]MDD3707074.1 arginine--tRNA ligase [Aminobacterium sp.]MDD4227981.1 arginine--tRNA ligase [Aminobacterium sp.]MDD4551172.1 arginine--tRNA ligase [Aminobacterium sp.]
MADVLVTLRQLLNDSIRSMAEEQNIQLENLPDFVIEKPKNEDHGDWATNAAMQLARIFHNSPRKLAEQIVDRLADCDYFTSVEIAGPGFINFRLSQKWMGEVLEEILTLKDQYGRQNVGQGEKVQVEFVSANPTGPLHVGHGRGAAVGDIIAKIMDFAGWNVQKEYYINDAGLQMKILGTSTQSRYFELLGHKDRAPFPEDAYKGEYIYDLAQEIIDKEGDRFLSLPLEESMEFFQTYAAGHILEGIKKDLADFGVHFDVWFSEKSLYERNLVPEAMDTLRKHGYAYEQDGALWFKATAFGDEKDRVLIRNNGVPTYFASDITYHMEKFGRGFERVIDIWGADHHGYVPRMKAGVEALGKDRESLEVVLIQFVNLLRGGEQVAMSTRSGQFVTLRDVINEVGVDATRYFFVMRRSDSHLDFDLELAKQSSNENPVYYVQYAHARICSVLKEAENRQIKLYGLEALNTELLTSDEEKKLVNRLSLFPQEVRRAAIDRAPHVIVNYAYDLASDFHSFYNANRILGERPDVMNVRLLLVLASKYVLSRSLSLLGLNAPERM